MAVLSVLMIAAGAALTFALEGDRQAEGFDLNTVGIILMIVGAVGLVVSMMRGSWVGFHSTRERRVSSDGRTVVERERTGGI